MHEGGISTPLIAHWPAQVTDRGALRQQPGHLIDIMATCVDVSGASYPKERDGEVIYPLEGRSLVPAFANQSLGRQEGLFWEHEGNRAVRKGDWKLVSKYQRDNPGPWELYDLKQDRTEMHNLADQRPEIVQELKAMYQAWTKRCHVMPWSELQALRKKKRKARKT